MVTKMKIHKGFDEIFEYALPGFSFDFRLTAHIAPQADETFTWSVFCAGDQIATGFGVALDEAKKNAHKEIIRCLKIKLAECESKLR